MARTLDLSQFPDTVEEDRDFLTYTGGEDETFGVNDLSEDHNYNIIDEQMKRRFGMSEDTHDRQEVIDAWVNYNRKFNVGQSVTVLGETAYLYKADDETKAVANNSYQLFDNMKGAFSEGTSTGEKLDAVGDYARGLIVDPVNLIGFGVGKLVSQGATKAAARAAKEGIKRASDKYIKDIGKEGLKRAALSEGEKQNLNLIRRRVLNKAMKGEEIEGIEAGEVASALKKERLKFGVGAAVGDTGAALTVEGFYQNALIKTNFQQEQDELAYGLTIAGGLFGGSLAYVASTIGKTKGPRDLAVHGFERVKSAEAAAIKMQEDAQLITNKTLALNLKNNPELHEAMKKSLKETKKKTQAWINKVRAGEDASRGTPTGDISADVLGFFLSGDEKQGIKGLSQIVEDAGFKLSNEDDAFMHHTDFLTSLVKELPDDVTKEVKELFDLTLKAENPMFANASSLNQGMDILARQASEAGKTLYQLSKSQKSIKEAGRRRKKAGKDGPPTGKEILDAELDPQSPEFVEGLRNKLQGGFSTAQNNLIRMLVTHPGTTALNVVGWSNASVMQSGSDMVRGALYGGASIGNLLVGRVGSAVEYAKKAKLMLTLQHQKMTNLVDPFATQEEVLDFLAFNPKIGKELFRYMSGGIDSNDVLKDLKLDFSDLEKPGAFEKVMSGMQTMYGVKAQDIFTKTQEFMYNIDKQIRIKHNVTYSEFLTATDEAGDPKYWRDMSGSDFFELQTRAVDDSLRNVFSKSYGKDASTLIGYTAKMIEEARRVPVIGAMIPFGQFFNNTLGFMFDHTGISLIHRYAAGTTRDPVELIAKSAVGLTILNTAGEHSQKGLEEGLEWHEVRADDGSVKSRLYDFPFSFYMGIGRIKAHFDRDGSAPPELIRDIVDTFGPRNLTRQLGDASKLSMDLIVDAASGENPDVTEALQNILGSSVAMYASGYTRPADPVSQIANLALGEEYTAKDRKVGNKTVNNSVRYIEGIFDAFEQVTGLEGYSVQEVVTKSTLGIIDAPRPIEGQRLETDQPQGAPIGRIMGYRESSSHTPVERAFAQVGIPLWKSGISAKIPEADNRMKKVISKYLNERATELLDSDAWKNSDNETRLKLLRAQIITPAKNDALLELKYSLNPDDRRMEIMYDISKRSGGYSDKQVREALEDIEFDGDITDLDENQLDFLRYTLEENKRDMLLNIKYAV
tara:strand:+ start:611 stop:4192 length:3582 start_codon:yes stop_codon:yes gene_type:complete